MLNFLNDALPNEWKTALEDVLFLICLRYNCQIFNINALRNGVKTITTPVIVRGNSDTTPMMVRLQSVFLR